jgi:hypothetical protein
MSFRIISHKELLIAGLLTIIYLFTGFTPNPLAWSDQINHRIVLTDSIQPQDPQIQVLNYEFESYFANDFVVLSSYPTDPEVLEVYAVSKFIRQRIKYTEDIINYLSWDYRPSISEVLNRGSDDCDGQAIVACSLLILRGYDSYVLIGKWHAWVEVELSDGSMLQILDSGLELISPWHTRFNSEKLELRTITLLDSVLHNYLTILFLEKSIVAIYLFFNRNKDLRNAYAILIALCLAPLPVLIAFSLFQP